MHSGRVNRSNITNLIGLVTMITAKNYAEFQKGYRMCNAGNGPKKTWKEMNVPFSKKPSEKEKLRLKQRKGGKKKKWHGLNR